MKLSKESDYAMRIVLYLAKVNKLVLAREVMEECKIPQRFGLRIVSSLVKMRILRSTPGINGGIVIAKAPKDISVYDVISPIEDLTLKDCVDDPEICKWRQGDCPVCLEMKKLKQEFSEKIKKLNFQYLLEREFEMDKARENKE